MKQFSYYAGLGGEDRACEWFVLMRSDRRTKTDVREYKKWLNSDRNHFIAYRHLEILWDLLGAYAVKPEIIAMLERARYETGKSGN